MPADEADAAAAADAPAAGRNAGRLSAWPL